MSDNKSLDNKSLEESEKLIEVDLSADLNENSEINLKQPDEVYYGIYMAARKKQNKQKKQQ